MNITLHNVRSLKSAELNGGGITLVTGKNTSGKTSLMNAVAAAFLGDAKIYGATKADASNVIRKGYPFASVRVSSGVQENGEDSPETWGRGLVWPFEGDIIEHGFAPPADEITMGRVDPAHDFDKKQWADFIRKIDGESAKFGWAETDAALACPTYDKQSALEIKQALKGSGWDSTAVMCKNRALDARRKWESITGDHFGCDKAAAWEHGSYRSDDDTEMLREMVKDLAPLLHCPHCTASVRLLREQNDPETERPTRMMLEVSDEAEISSKWPSTKSDRPADWDEAYERLEAQTITELARKSYEIWAFWTHAADVTGPLGVRYKATKRAVEQLQPKLDEIAKKIFPEHQVEIHANEDGLDLTFDGFPYKSMVWNNDPNSYGLGIQVMFQILHAEQLGPETPILIDRADTMDKRRLGGVLNCLVQRKRQAVVAKTVAERPETDLLANAKVGATYYINNGTVEAV